MNLGTAQVIRANSRHLPLADNSVDLVVTSPPYFALRSYQDGGEHYAGQIGDEPTPDEFVSSLLEVTAECVRVLKLSGSLWVNLGDKYAGSAAGGTQNGAVGHGPKGGKRGHVRTATGIMPQTDIRPKSLIGIPWRYALRCIDDLGLILRAEVIWSKPNGLPESVTDRVRRSHEQWFHFTLSPRYFSAGKLPGSVWTVPTEPLRVPDHLGIDHFAAFPTEWPKRIIQGWSPAGVCVECGEGRRPVSERDSSARRPSGAQYIGKRTRIERNIVGANRAADVTTTHTITGYACACPEPNACKTCAKVQSEPHPHLGDISNPKYGRCDALPHTTPAVVLDPFGGTGTTAMVAKALGRHGISVDMSADYCRLAEWRTGDRDQLAKVLGIAKADTPPDADQLDLFGEPA